MAEYGKVAVRETADDCWGNQTVCQFLKIFFWGTVGNKLLVLIWKRDLETRTLVRRYPKFVKIKGSKKI